MTRTAVGTSGRTMMYDLVPRTGVNLSAHVGHRVEIAGVMLDPAKGDDDAEVTIREDTKVKADDAPDARVRTKTKAELPRGAHSRLSVVSVKPCPAPARRTRHLLRPSSEIRRSGSSA